MKVLDLFNSNRIRLKIPLKFLLKKKSTLKTPC